MENTTISITREEEYILSYHSNVFFFIGLADTICWE